MRLILSLMGALAVAVVVFLAFPKTSPLDQAETLFARGEYVSAFKIYLAEADEGDPLAQFAVGRILEQGLGPELYDPALAFEYIERSAKSGYGYAMLWLSEYYNSSNLEVRDDEASLLWLGEAVDQNIPGAWLKLLGDERLYMNMALVQSWAEQGKPFALNVMYYSSGPLGVDVACSWREQIKTFDTAVSLLSTGQALAQNTCGDGDVGAGLARMEQAGEMGFVPAMMALAEYHSDKSLDETLYWTMVAARMGEQAPADVHEMIQVRSVGIPDARLQLLKDRVKQFKVKGQPPRLRAAEDMR